MQSAQHLPGARVAARAAPLVHRDGVGLLHAAGAHPVPAGDSHPVLGEVLRPESAGGLVRLRRPHTGDDHLPGLRHSLLPIAGHAQVRGDGVGHPGAGDAQGADGAGPPRSSQQHTEQWPAVRRIRGHCLAAVVREHAPSFKRHILRLRALASSDF